MHTPRSSLRPGRSRISSNTETISKSAATAAWTWATANPNVLYYNNDNSKQPGSKGLAAGQQEMSETDRLRAQFEAATYLFEMTGEAQFKQFADANYGALLPPWGPSMWEVDALDSLLYYARLPGATPEVAKSIRERFMVNLSRTSRGVSRSLCSKQIPIVRR